MSPTASNLTEDALEESEARARAILETAVDAVVVIDERGSVETFNPAAERMFGMPAAEVVGHNVKVLMPEPFHREHDGYMANYLITGQRKIIGIGREVLGRRRDGSLFPIDLAVSEAWLGRKRIFVGIIRDLTERRQAELALRETNRQLEKALAELQVKTDEVKAMTQQLWQAAKLAAVGELAASIAHELNNPLAIVSLRLESVLNQTQLDDARRRPLEIIEQEVERMSSLVANVLQFSRREERRVSTVEISEDLVKTLDLILHRLQHRRIQVVKAFAASIPAIQADRQLLRQVFLNLLTNASDAMPEGGTLTLRLDHGDLPGGRRAVVVEFGDTGVGIPKQHLEKVMEPFYTTKAAGKGTGLGLAICRRAIQEHQGTIQIASEVGKGTTVRIKLPLGGDTAADCSEL